MNEERLGHHNEAGGTYQWVISVHHWDAFIRDKIALTVIDQEGRSVTGLLNRAQFHGMTREQFEQAVVFTYVSHVIQNWDNLIQVGEVIELFDIPLKVVSISDIEKRERLNNIKERVWNSPHSYPCPCVFKDCPGKIVPENV